MCPGCRSETLANAAHCTQCGADLATLRGLAKLREEIDAIERRLTTPRQGVARKVATPPPPPPKPAMAPPPPPPPPPRKPEEPSGRSELAIGQRWLLVAGVIITTLGLGYFLKYSFDQNWIGPWGRVALAYIAGAVFLRIGEVTRRKGLATFGLYLLGGGIAMLYLATFSAFQIYHLVNQATAFAVMVLITAFAGVLALSYDKMGLAVLGIVGGFATPLLLSTGVANQIVLMSYMAILNAGIIGIAFFKRWAALNYLGFVFTWLLFSGWYFEHYTTSAWIPTLLFANVFFLVYAIAPFLFFFRNDSKANVAGFFITVPNAFIGLGFSASTIKSVLSTYEVSAVTVTYALIFLGLARHLYARHPGNTQAIAMLLGKAVLFLVITVPILFSGHVITLLWAAEAATLMWAARRLDNRWLYRAAGFVLVMTVGKFFIYDWTHLYGFDPDECRFYLGFGNAAGARWVTNLTVLACTFAVARFATGTARAVYHGVFGAALFAILTVETCSFFTDVFPEATFAAISVVWTIYSVLLMGVGFARNQAPLRKVALALFAVTVLKVMVWDMANASTPFRVISFVVLGLMLIGASFLYYRLEERISPRGKVS